MRFKAYGYILGSAAAILVAAAPAIPVAGDACGIATTVYLPTVTTVYISDVDITVTATTRSTKQVHHTVTAVVTVTSTLMTSSESSLEPISTDINTADGEGVVTNPVIATTSSLEPVSTSTDTDDGDGIFSFYVTGTSTVWLNGQTPDVSKPVVYLTTSLTVTPTITHTTTVRSTSQSTIWTTETVQPSLSSSIGSSFTGVGSMGWNKTSAYSISGSGYPTQYVPFLANTSTGFGTGISTPMTSAPFLNSTFTESPAFPTNSSVAASTFTSQAFPVTFNNHTTAFANGTAPSVSTKSLGNFTGTISPASPITSFSADPTMISISYPIIVNSTAVPASNFTGTTSSASPMTNSSADPTLTSFQYPVTVNSIAVPTGNFTFVSSNLTISSTTITVSPIPLTSFSADPAATTSMSTSVFAPLINSTATMTSSSVASASPTTCGEIGDFVLNFDDIPPLAVNNDTDPHDVQPAPVFNPYHQFDFSEGFTVVPPPTTLFVPESGKLLLEFIPSPNGTNPGGLGSSGGISDGDHGLTGCFDFNFYGASFGCDSRGADCDFMISGYRLVDTDLVQVASQSNMIPACQTADQCELTHIDVDDSFQNLDSIRIYVTVAGVPKIWWMDDLKLGWFNNTCDMGLCRQNAHLH